MTTPPHDGNNQEKELQKALEKELSGLSLPKDKVQKIASLVVEKKYIFSSGLIPPEILQHIEDLFPGYGQKFLDSYFSEIEHRRSLENNNSLIEKKAQENTDKKDFKDINTQRFGMASAFFIVILMVSIGSYLFYIDKKEGGITVIGAIATIIGIFVFRNVRGKHEPQTIDTGKKKQSKK